MDFDFTSSLELIDIRPERSRFIHSMSEPFSEEDIEDEVMHNWLDHFEYISATTVHLAKEQETTSLVEHVNPKNRFKYTENQQMFKEIGNNVQTTIYGESYSLTIKNTGAMSSSRSSKRIQPHKDVLESPQEPRTSCSY
jgi:hypothetical protein